MTVSVPPGLTARDLHVEPLERAETIPARWYTAPAFHAFDREAVLARRWQYAGHVSRLPDPGTYLCADVAGRPVVIVRDREGTLRAFYNVCRHRGGPLAMDACGHLHKGVLQCQYHGWTYRLDGSLRGVPRFDRTDLFDKRDYGLVPVALAEWDGLLFVHLAADPQPPIEEVIAGIGARIAPQRLATKTFYRRDVYDVACNWKVYVDNYLEGYHIPLVHPELCQVLDYRAYVTETARYHSLQYSPIRDGEQQYGAAEGDAYYYFLFPNMMLNILPGRLQVNLVEPLAPDRCRVIFDYYYDDVASPEARRAIERDLAFSDRVQQEDIAICEHVQRGLASGAYDRGRFSAECEEGVYHFQTLLKEAYAEALANTPAEAGP
ncbi:aromatic ring-hydroxylating dioxygenase subunit alpha [Rhodocaloribacter litoris]|uniref:aromatic ring-hydroxylating oxygenase subunit alpha n=1 Tax=Rhodocaloribacter litoris TaxID=2558931 RepID=UPI00141E6173|nr:aromatic ring-hydroxylating dioxygenase subunit alpha [Rhodocaloribacter litoris]QXD17000.1 aromatic ring-hydroxylating dioxygenase subunit alpha [Rhodocaloribacter litoris]